VAITGITGGRVGGVGAHGDDIGTFTVALSRSDAAIGIASRRVVEHIAAIRCSAHVGAHGDDIGTFTVALSRPDAAIAISGRHAGTGSHGDDISTSGMARTCNDDTPGGFDGRSIEHCRRRRESQ
jgi:hypothetical protein